MWTLTTRCERVGFHRLCVPLVAVVLANVGLRAQVRLVWELLLAVPFADLCQDNVSCLNTALAIVILHYRRGSLANFLSVRGGGAWEGGVA